MQQLTWPDVIDGVGDWTNPNLRNNLVGAWVPALGPTGGTLHDVSGRGNDGTLTNMEPGTDWVASKNGWALDFDGVDEFVGIGIKGPLQISGSQTVVSNVLVDSVSSRGVIYSRWDFNTGNRGVIFEINTGGTLRGIFSQDGTYNASYVVSGGTSIAVSEWRSVALVLDTQNTTSAVYLDGVNDGEDATSVSSVWNASTRSDIGIEWDSLVSQTSNEINGRVATTLIYSRALTPTEIYHLYLDPLAPFRRRVFMPFGAAATPATTTATSYFYQHLLAGTSC